MADDGTSRELCGLIDELAHRIAEHVRGCAAGTDLTSSQAIALRELNGPLTMRELAERMHCATSNVTFVVDRLEKLGLVDRCPHPQDRRAKTLVLTEEGRRQRTELLDRFAVDTPLANLGEDDRRTLDSILRKALRAR